MFFFCAHPAHTLHQLLTKQLCCVTAGIGEDVTLQDLKRNMSPNVSVSKLNSGTDELFSHFNTFAIIEFEYSPL